MPSSFVNFQFLPKIEQFIVACREPVPHQKRGQTRIPKLMDIYPEEDQGTSLLFIPSLKLSFGTIDC